MVTRMVLVVLLICWHSLVVFNAMWWKSCESTLLIRRIDSSASRSRRLRAHSRNSAQFVVLVRLKSCGPHNSFAAWRSTAPSSATKSNAVSLDDQQAAFSFALEESRNIRSQLGLNSLWHILLYILLCILLWLISFDYSLICSFVYSFNIFIVCLI